MGELMKGPSFATIRADTKFFNYFLPSKLAGLLSRGPGLAGPVVGVLTACTTPLLWSYMFDICWGDDFKNMVTKQYITTV